MFSNRVDFQVAYVQIHNKKSALILTLRANLNNFSNAPDFPE